ncbi:MAG: protein kinase [Rubrivivax sp.]|nr:protein kinase [Rubrivivax sp.]
MTAIPQGVRHDDDEDATRPGSETSPLRRAADDDRTLIAPVETAHDDRTLIAPMGPAQDDRTVIAPAQAHDDHTLIAPARDATHAPTMLLSSEQLEEVRRQHEASGGSGVKPLTTPAPPTLPKPVAPISTLPGAAADDGELKVTQVGRYQVHERLGRGGMASVFRAHDPQIGRDVAIKFLHSTLSQDADCRMRFLREARAAGGLSHPNIAVVHDVGEIEGRPYMAMELLSGTTLSLELEQRKTLPVREAVTVAMQLAKALDYAHKRGIVHRDIKPGNIMRDAGSGAVKVTDFGIAHIENTATEMRTRVGDIIGTPQYMSPEQARGEKLDGRSDLFSVGIVLYQMVTGVRPFRGESVVAVATKIVNEEAPPIDKTRTDITPALRRVIDRCLAKQPAMRFQSGKELLEALGRVRTEIDEAAREASRPRIVPLRVKWALAMALIVAVVMGATAFLITQRQQAAMMAQVTDNGASLAGFIAKQHAAAALAEDWEAVDIAVQEMMKTGTFERLAVVDLGGIVRASSDAATVGQPYRPPAAEVLGTLPRGVTASRFAGTGSQPVLGFDAPITFQDKRVGQVYLGIHEAPLTQVARLSITLMVVLVLVTIAAVAVAMFFLAQWFAKPVQVLSESMGEMTKGHLSHRIGERRNDEFGLLYADFDAMAQALQDRFAAGDASRPSMNTVLPATQTARSPAPPAH